MEEASFTYICKFASIFLICKFICSLYSPLKQLQHFSDCLVYEINNIFNAFDIWMGVMILLSSKIYPLTVLEIPPRYAVDLPDRAGELLCHSHIPYADMPLLGLQKWIKSSNRTLLTLSFYFNFLLLQFCFVFVFSLFMINKLFPIGDNNDSEFDFIDCYLVISVNKLMVYTDLFCFGWEKKETDSH